MSTKPPTARKGGVTLLRPGVGAQEFDLPPDSTVADLLREAQAVAPDQAILINGVTLEEALALQPGMVVSVISRPRAASPEGSWRETVGMFRDDPEFEEMARAVEARREADRRNGR